MAERKRLDIGKDFEIKRVILANSYLKPEAFADTANQKLNAPAAKNTPVPAAPMKNKWRMSG